MEKHTFGLIIFFFFLSPVLRPAGSLFQESVYPEQRPDVSSIAKSLLDRINNERQARNLPLLIRSSELSSAARNHCLDMAAQISHRLKTKKERAFQIGIPLGTEVLSYQTGNPEVWPAAAEEKLYRSSLRRIGIGISSRIDKKKRTAAFWVTLIFRN